MGGRSSTGLSEDVVVAIVAKTRQAKSEGLEGDGEGSGDANSEDSSEG